MRSRCKLWMLAMGATLVVARAHAQPLNPTINPTTSPIQVQQTQEKVAVRPAIESRRFINIAFGATALGGNTKTYAGNLGGRFGLNRDRHQLTVEALGSLGGARQGRVGDVEWTSRNVIARARYDVFLSREDALFVAMAPRRDIFAGIDIRLQNQVGYSRNLFAGTDAHRLWTELGYDFTYDRLAVESTVTDDITTQVRAANPALTPDGTKSVVRTVKTRGPGESDFVHSARIFLGYTNRLFNAANLSLGIETLFDFTDKGNVRVNGLGEFTSSVTQSFKLGVQSRVMYDREPVSGKLETDVIATVQLVYTFDSLGTSSSVPCPPCPDCKAQVGAARKEACLPSSAKPATPATP